MSWYEGPARHSLANDVKKTFLVGGQQQQALRWGSVRGRVQWEPRE